MHAAPGLAGQEGLIWLPLGARPGHHQRTGACVHRATRGANEDQMAAAQGQCPGCGSPIEFRAGSSVTAVCKYCNTTSRRSDRGIENLGRMADLADTPTIVAVGDGGTIAGRGFVVLGRVQLQHDLGGVWDEWYLGFQGGGWGWLAYAQGNFYVTSKMEPAPPVPSMQQLRLEAPVQLGQAGVFRVVELKQAKIASAEGELPFAPRPGQPRYYADLVGPQAGFATLDWGEGNTPPEVFVGRQLPETQLAMLASDAGLLG